MMNDKSLAVIRKIKDSQQRPIWAPGLAGFAGAMPETILGYPVIVNNDIMPHKLVKLSGPALALAANANMNHMGATTHLKFAKAGAYKFTTRPGEDYMKGMNTIGEDNLLKLTVTVR